MDFGGLTADAVSMSALDCPEAGHGWMQLPV
jgi:hypothetical protein